MHASLPRFCRLFGSGIIVAWLDFRLLWLGNLNDHFSGSFAERAHRSRRTTMDLHDGEPLCQWGMDLNTPYQKCPNPKWKVHEYHSCVRYVECSDDRSTSHDLHYFSRLSLSWALRISSRQYQHGTRWSSTTGSGSGQETRDGYIEEG